ncbi:hypothetical protein SAMN04488134_109102 [Amphibacillus marinus]|uniref:Uncharacterized protein n=2 Tax=Amphibacillus marinus TaxID=872970 RepID=A0A1H8QZY0_9BACI|nr:hypothetical protein SAMN04488134_109102 [Amphibacillus marinus]
MMRQILAITESMLEALVVLHVSKASNTEWLEGIHDVANGYASVMRALKVLDIKLQHQLDSNFQDILAHYDNGERTVEVLIVEATAWQRELEALFHPYVLH